MEKHRFNECKLQLQCRVGIADTWLKIEMESLMILECEYLLHSATTDTSILSSIIIIYVLICSFELKNTFVMIN